MLWVLRIALYVQLLLGLGRFAGLVVQQRVWETHISLGILTVVLALLLLRPHPQLGADRVRAAARLAPLVALLTGGIMYFDLTRNLAMVVFHMLVGLLTVALVEMAAAREKRQLGRAGKA